MSPNQTYENQPVPPPVPFPLEAKRENFGVLAPEAKTQVAPLRWGVVLFFWRMEKPPWEK